MGAFLKRAPLLPLPLIRGNREKDYSGILRQEAICEALI
jgi:hypothetical protein